MTAKYIVFDTETSGLRPENANLLSVHFCVLDDKLNNIDELNLNIKYPFYTIYTKALSVNKISLEEHEKTALFMNYARIKLKNFLYSVAKTKLIPIGHNIQFDINFIKQSGLLSEIEYNKFMHVNYLDTIVIAQFLKSCNIIPSQTSMKLSILCDHFGINTTGNLHTAEYDVKLTIELFKKMQNKTASSNHDLISNKKRKFNCI